MTMPSTAKAIDKEKIEAFLKSNAINASKVCGAVGVNSHYISSVKKRGWTNIPVWKLICQELNVPEDYFDLEEPKPIMEKPKEEECLVDLADIQLSLNKIEVLLLEQNKMLRGKSYEGS